MHQHVNPILRPDPNPTRGLDGLRSPTVHRRPLGDARRSLRDARRTATAAEAIAGFDRSIEIFGFTKAQFSLIDLLAALLKVTGPAHLTISTWTAASADVTRVLEFLDGDQLTGTRWLVDLTFSKRAPQLAQRIRQAFGGDSIRVAKNHAKFALLRNDDWSVVLRTSMNLNFNPRFENFSIAHDPAMADFLSKIIDEIWRSQPAKLADAPTGDAGRFFDRCM